MLPLVLAAFIVFIYFISEFLSKTGSRLHWLKIVSTSLVLGCVTLFLFSAVGNTREREGYKEGRSAGVEDAAGRPRGSSSIVPGTVYTVLAVIPNGYVVLYTEDGLPTFYNLDAVLVAGQKYIAGKDDTFVLVGQ